MELVPRITRAQKMDALSSQANLAGYSAVIIASQELQKALPMMMTAAGTSLFKSICHWCRSRWTPSNSNG